MSVEVHARRSRYAASEAQMDRARRTLAGGVSTAMRAGQRPMPLVMDRGDGPHVYDIDGRRYIDYVLGFGPLLLGHCHPAVVAAVSDQVRRGLTFGAQHRLEAEVSERIVDLVPCAELTCLATTGSEAVQVALRLARAHTGRPKILKFEGHYHGWLDPVHVSTAGLEPAGPDEAAPLAQRPGTGGQAGSADVLVARWNDAGELERVLAEHGNEIAAVLMEPVGANGGLIQPAPGYLERARELCDRSGALLIYDEVVTGFRVALGGAQERFGVTPDLATYGKAIAGGMPLSAVAGRRDVMEQIADGRVKHVGTFNGNPPAAAAAVAALDTYRDGAPALYQELDGLSERLADGLEHAAAAAGVPLRIHREGPLLQTFVAGAGAPIASYADSLIADGEAFGAFTEEMLERGSMILPRGWWFLSTAHTAGDIDHTVASAHEAFAVTRERLGDDYFQDQPATDGVTSP